MFCENCGKENIKSAKYCEDCGHQLNNVKRYEFSKKNKIFIMALLIIISLLGITYIGLSSSLSPSSIAKAYFISVMDGDTDRLYKYMNLDNSGFTSKEIFKKVSGIKKQDMLNYSLVSEEKSTDGLTSTVKINYTLIGEYSAQTATIHLIKNKKNKFLIFDNWKINDDTISIVKNYSVTAPKNSKVLFEGINLDKSYLDNKSKAYDTYKIPALLKGKYKVNVTLENGLMLEDIINVNDYGANLTSLNISQKEIKKISKLLPKTIETLYQNAIDNKSYDVIKKDYEYAGGSFINLKNSYETFKNQITSSGLKKFKVNKVVIEKSKLSGSYLTVNADVSYEYTSSHEFLGESREVNKKENDTMYFDFDYVNNEYKLVDISSMARYF